MRTRKSKNPAERREPPSPRKSPVKEPNKPKKTIGDPPSKKPPKRVVSRKENPNP